MVIWEAAAVIFRVCAHTVEVYCINDAEYFHFSCVYYDFKELSVFLIQTPCHSYKIVMYSSVVFKATVGPFWKDAFFCGDY